MTQIKLHEFSYRSPEDKNQQQPETAGKEDAVAVIDEAPNAVVFFCELMSSVRDAFLNANSDNATTQQTQTQPNNFEPSNHHTRKSTDTLLTIINTQDLVVLFCEY